MADSRGPSPLTCSLSLFISLSFLLLLCVLTEAVEELHGEREIPVEEIIALPVGHFPEPDCDYTVHREAIDGPQVSGCRQVRVGDLLHHRWKCDYGSSFRDSSPYCILVNNCSVSSQRHASSTQLVPIVDEFGCSLFPVLIPHVSYSSDLVAGLPAHAFSLDIDQPAVYFQCNIKLLLKLNGVCRRPMCRDLRDFQRGAASSRARRFV